MGRSTGARVRTSGLLVYLLLMCLSAAQSKLLVPSQSVVVGLGSDVILPCGLDSAVDVTAETLEWTRSDLRPRFVLVWRSGQEFVNIKNPAYAGRTSLFTDELKTGNISLKISTVALGDEGKYKCFIPDKNEEAFVELMVAVAASPVIRLAGLDRDRGGVVLECRSGGWFPEPELLWLDAEGNLLSAGPTETVRGSDDLYTVSSRVTVEKRHSSRYTCRVQRRSINQKTEAHIHVPDDFFNFPSASSAATVGLSITLAVCTVIFLLLFLLKMKNIIKCKRHRRDGNHRETKKLMTNKLQDQQIREEAEKTLRAELNAKKREVELQQTELHQLQEEKKKKENTLLNLKTKLGNVTKELETIQATKTPVFGKDEYEKKKKKKGQMKAELEKLKEEVEIVENKLQDQIIKVEIKHSKVISLLQDVIKMNETLVGGQETNNIEIKNQTPNQLQEQQRREEAEKGVKTLQEKLETKNNEVEQKQAELQQLQDNKKNREKIMESVKKELEKKEEPQPTDMELLNELEKKELMLQITIQEFENKQTELRLLQEMIEIIKGSLQMMDYKQTNNVKTNKKQNKVKQDEKQEREQAAEHKQKDPNIITRHHGDGGNTEHVTV